MLIQLQRLHATILAGLDELDALTAQPQPPMDRLPALRLTLTRASRARFMLLERIYEQLITHGPSDRAAEIQALRVEGRGNRVASTLHIGTWTLREITARWPDYCAASNAMRSAMRQRVRKEAAIIYPLLSASSVRVSAA